MPAILDKILRIGEGKILRQLEAIAQAVNAIEDDFVAMTDAELQGMTKEFKERFENGESLDDLMPEAFATVREAAKRVIGQRHLVEYWAHVQALMPVELWPLMRHRMEK